MTYFKRLNGKAVSVQPKIKTNCFWAYYTVYNIYIYYPTTHLNFFVSG